MLSSWDDDSHSSNTIVGNSTRDDKNTTDTSDDVYELNGGNGEYKYYAIINEPNIPVSTKFTNGEHSYLCIGYEQSGSYIISSLTNYGTFENNGRMEISYIGSLTIPGGTFIHSSDNFDNYGTITMAGESTMKVSAGTKVNNNSILNITGSKNTIDLESTGEGNTAKIGTFTNSGTITIEEGKSLTISGDGKFTNDNYIKNEGSMTLSGNCSFVMNWGHLDVSGKFYVNDSNNHNVTLNGTIAINSQDASVDVYYMNFFPGDVEETVEGETVTVNKDSHGFINMSQLRPYSASDTAVNTFNNHDFFKFSTSQDLPGIVLPFNCKFAETLDLRKAVLVSYTVLQLVEGNMDGIVIRKDEGRIIGAYGDYADGNLGVTLPASVTKEYSKGMSLSWLISEKDNNEQPKYNKCDYKLLTNDLILATDLIAADETHTYNFGFKGTKAISITSAENAENTKAVFNGDNSEYNPSSAVTLPNNVEFGNKSLFQFTQTYKHGVFTAGNYANTIPEGKIVTFTGGFTLGAGHTLIVKGTLIG